MNKKETVLLIVGLIAISILMPLHLTTPTPTTPIENSTCLGCGEHPDSIPMFILAVLFPIIVCLGIALSFAPKQDNKTEEAKQNGKD